MRYDATTVVRFFPHIMIDHNKSATSLFVCTMIIDLCLFVYRRLPCCINNLSSTSWSIACNVGRSISNALAILDKSKPNCMSKSMKSNSSPVNGCRIFGQRKLHCGHAQWSMRWWLHWLSCCSMWCKSCWSNRIERRERRGSGEDDEGL